MFVQILDEYKNRTEYRMLKGFYNCQIANLDALQKGVLVLPGILLNRIDKEQLNLLNIWLEDSNNQLILTPTWIEMNLKNFFDSSIDILITKTDSSFDKISVGYKIEATVKDTIFQQDGKIFGVNYRRNTGTGLITVVTLPLLDYRLIQFEYKLKNLFDFLFQVDVAAQDSTVEIKNFVLNDIHIYLIILLGAQVDLVNQMPEKIKKYFGVTVDEETAMGMYKDLVAHQYINSDALTNKGMDVVKERKLKSFIQVVKKRGEKEDGWI